MSTRTLELDLTERVLDERALPGSGPAEHGPPRPASRPAVRALVATLVALGVALPIAAGVATLPVHSVRISGDFVRVSKADIERAVAPLLSSRLVRIDVDALRHAALAVPGVREATVRRVWPDSLEILVIEHVAVGRWAGGGYLGSDGTHFTPNGGGAADSLPVLTGPAGSQRRVLDLHVALERVLAPVGPRDGFGQSLGDELLRLLLEAVGQPLEEEQAEDVGLVVAAVDRPAQDVGGRPEGLFELGDAQHVGLDRHHDVLFRADSRALRAPACTLR